MTKSVSDSHDRYFLEETHSVLGAMIIDSRHDTSALPTLQGDSSPRPSMVQLPALPLVVPV
jgi:hypothetical protein